MRFRFRHLFVSFVCFVVQSVPSTPPASAFPPDRELSQLAARRRTNDDQINTKATCLFTCCELR